MRRIDELFLKYPFYGARRMALHLRREGVRIGRRRAARPMRPMGLQAIYRAPHPEHRVWPYLLRSLTIERANHVWCADITYIPVNRGFLPSRSPSALPRTQHQNREVSRKPIACSASALSLALSRRVASSRSSSEFAPPPAMFSPQPRLYSRCPFDSPSPSSGVEVKPSPKAGKP